MEWIQRMDFMVLDWIQQHLKSGTLDFWMPLLTKLGDKGIFFAALALILFCTKKYRRQGMVLFTAFFFCVLGGNLLLKPLVGRTRPYDLVKGFQLLVEPLRDFSFPSGHTMISFACAAVFWRYRERFQGWSAVLLLAAVLIAFSRLYLYVHFPTDVMCGALLGWLFGQLAAWTVERKRKSKQNT